MQLNLERGDRNPPPKGTKPQPHWVHNTGPAAREPLPEAAGANGGMTYGAQHFW